MKKVIKNFFLSFAILSCGVTPISTGLSFLTSVAEFASQETMGDADTVASQDAFVKSEEQDDIVDDDTSQISSENVAQSATVDKSKKVVIEELWNDETKSFYSSTVTDLVDMLGNKNNTTIDDIVSISQEIKNSADFRSNTYKKKEKQNINVMLGGLEWTACYLSQDKNGNPILTLWLADSYQDKFVGLTSEAGLGYGFYAGSLFSSYCPTVYGGYTYTDKYPIRLYGTSYIRAVTLNNGGKHSLNKGTELSDDVGQDPNSVFAIYTIAQDGNDLTDYIVKPIDVGWQETQDAKLISGASYSGANDSWGLLDESQFTNENKPFQTNEYYDQWKNDNLWIPSQNEVYWDIHNPKNSLWQVDIEQGKNLETLYNNFNLASKSIAYVNGESTWRSYASVDYYTRTAPTSQHSNLNIATVYLAEFGTLADYRAERSWTNAVRPALHLNLKSIMESLPADSSTYTINYDLGGGVAGVYPHIMESGSAFSLKKPVRDYYEFDGWSITSGGDFSTARYGKSSADLNIVDTNTKCGKSDWKRVFFKDLCAEGQSVTLTANWKHSGKLVTYRRTAGEYFEDNNITADDITDADYSGRGTIDNPYIIKSGKGFRYLARQKKYDFGYARYIELGNDIILNDESFDESGNALSGDGIAYEWTTCSYYYSQYSRNAKPPYFDGKGHTIYGLYQFQQVLYKTTTSSWWNSFRFFGGLFGEVVEIKNLNLKYVFSLNPCLVSTAEDIINCHASDGYSGKGMCETLKKSMDNCSNKLDILYGSGVISTSGYNEITIKNVTNYGNISGDLEQYYCGGIIGYINKTAKLINCKNYGNITLKKPSGEVKLGGIVGASTNSYGGCKQVVISNCANYGTLTATGTYIYIGGIVGRGEDVPFLLDNCTSKGQIKIDKKGAMFVDYGSNVSLYNCDAIVKNSKNAITGNGARVIKNVQVTYDLPEVNFDWRMLSGYYYYTLDIDNLIINMKCKKFTGEVISTDTRYGYECKLLTIKDFIFNLDCEEVNQNIDIFRNASKNRSLNGVLISMKTPSNSIKKYYGTNFRDFYVSWKYGNIGLKTIDGVGSTQGSISTEWLDNDGWVKAG